MLPGQVANRLGCDWETRCLPEMDPLDLEMSGAIREMSCAQSVQSDLQFV